jgi:hypothetical protein
MQSTGTASCDIVSLLQWLQIGKHSYLSVTSPLLPPSVPVLVARLHSADNCLFYTSLSNWEIKRCIVQIQTRICALSTFLTMAGL